jgi:hypothetical protein
MYDDFTIQIQSDELAALDGSYSWDFAPEDDYPHDLVLR